MARRQSGSCESRSAARSRRRRDVHHRETHRPVSANPMSPAQLGIALDGTLLTAAWCIAPTAREANANTWRTLVVPCDGTAQSIAAALRDIASQSPVCGDV